MKKILKNIFKSLIIFFCLSIFTKVSAVSIPVTEVFSDIDSDYKYINQLQALYDKGAIKPDADGKFNPKKLLTRDEFVGIASEVSCKECIQPNTVSYFLDKYSKKPFFDIGLQNDYFYCIADAKENDFVSGYDYDYKCDDDTFRAGNKPFCAKNNIILEEALAVLLRMSGILTVEQAENIREIIRAGNIKEDLSLDVKAKNEDESVYSFYPDFMKALNYEIMDYDKNGNGIKYVLIEKKDNRLYPKANISKEKFLQMAFVALKASSCIDKCDRDFDKDNVNDCLDLCPLIKGDVKNSGCPIFDTKQTKNYEKNCLYDGGDLISLNVICKTCPCDNSIDFTSTIRKCDKIFPAITSPDSKELYSRGNIFEVR